MIPESTIPVLNILLVDDDYDDQEFFKDAIEELKTPCTLHIANNYVQLFDRLEEESKIELIFMDINMPVCDGRECLKKMKEHEKHKHIPVVMFSGSQAEPDVDCGYKLGAHYHIVKPATPAHYVASLKRILDLDWKIAQPFPPRENYLINLAY